MRKFVAPVMCAVVMLGTVIVSAGCSASAQLDVGKTPPQPPPPAAAPAPPPPPPAVKRQKLTNFQMENGALKLPSAVVFETGSDKLKPESDEVLQVVKDYLDAKPDLTLLRIEGHTDNDGGKDSNQTLSEKRSLAVARWLTAAGEKCDRLLPVGYGQMKPIAGTPDKQTPDEKTLNRRVAFVNAAIKGKPIGGMPVDGGGHVAGDPCK
jgi:OmpA-OmpF porin, OOP family